MTVNKEDLYPDNFVDVGLDDYGNIYHKDANGRYHNPYGPAVIYSDGGKFYYIHGKLHRTDGPAVIWPDGYKAYYIHGKEHRTDGPAEIYSDGYKAYYVNGERHRTDGPAVIYSNGYAEYWVNGKELSKQEFNALQPQLQAKERDRLFESQPDYSKETMPNINENTGKRYTSLVLTKE